MRFAPTLVVIHPLYKIAGYDRIIIEREGRRVLDVIAHATVKAMEKIGCRSACALIDWHDLYLLRNELGAKWLDDTPSILNTPVGAVRILVDPTVEIGVRVLPATGDYLNFLNKPELLELR